MALGDVNTAYDLDKSLAISDLIEDQEIARKMDMRK